MNNKIINILGFLLIAVFLSPLVTSAAIGVTWTATSTTPGYISPNTINGYAPGIGVTGNSNLNMGLNSTTGFGSSTPYADLSIHANNGEVNRTLFAIASSTATATTTLFTVDNTGNVVTPGTVSLGSGAAGANLVVNGGTLRIFRAAVGDGSLNVLSGGINLSSTGFLAQNSGSIERARFLSTGQYGIGTTTPYALSSIHADNGSTNTTLFAIGSSTQTATTTLFTIDNTGTVNFGGGTTISGLGVVNINNHTIQNPGLISGANLTISGVSATFSGAATTTGTAYFGSKVGVGTSTPFAQLAVHTNNGSTNTTLFAIGSSTQTATTTLFTVTNSGNVGINVTNPSTQLQVAANSAAGEMTPIILQNVSNANGAATSLGFSQNATLSGPLTGKISSIRNNASSFDIALYSSTGAGTVTEGLRLTSARNLGVGSTSPNAKLSVNANNGDTNQFVLAIASSTQTATTTLMSVDNMGNVTSGNSITASTTRTFVGKWQMDTYNTAGTEICAFFVGTTLSASTGACHQ